MNKIFTDGSSRGNPGPGGWGTIVISNIKDKIIDLDNEKTNLKEVMIAELGGHQNETTNNRMEIIAAIKGILHTAQWSSSTIYTDSSYLINGITKWISGWKRNGWQTKTKEDVQNKDLWIELDQAIKERNIKWEYVGGHVGILGNERCDHIATAFADERKISLYKGDLAGYDIPNILDISMDEIKASTKKSSSSHSKAKAYSYVSSVGGVIERHRTWAECERRVKGAKGARYKKTLSRDDEERITGEFEMI